jgi:hypothetical protein
MLTSERKPFYQWKSNDLDYLRRGTALVFSQSEQDPRSKRMIEILKMWEYEPEWKHLETVEATLKSCKLIIKLKISVL